MDQPLVSVIIPVYNSERYIQEAVESISKQTYSNLEIIIINDGSTDNSLRILQDLADQDKRILLVNQENSGQCVASNNGFGLSTGTYIKFFDADDILSPETIERQIQSLKGKDDAAVSYIDYVRFFDDDLATTGRYKLPALINYDCSPEEYITFHGSPQMYQCSLWLFHRNIFDRTGLWDERLSLINDTEFFPRILKHVSRLYYAPGCKVFYRTNYNSGSLSQVVSSKSMRSALLSVDLMAKHTRSFIQSETMERIIAQSYVEILEMSYPSQPKWARIIGKRLKAFRRDQYEYLLSGPLYNFILKNLGWKTAKRFQRIYYKIRYRKKSNRNKT